MVYGMIILQTSTNGLHPVRKKINRWLKQWAQFQLANYRLVLTRLVLGTLGFCLSAASVVLIEAWFETNRLSELATFFALLSLWAFGGLAAYGYLCLCCSRLLDYMIQDPDDAK